LVGAAGIEPAAPRFARHVRGGFLPAGGYAPRTPMVADSIPSSRVAGV